MTMQTMFLKSMLLIVSCMLMLLPLRASADEARLEIGESNIDTSDFPNIRVTVGVWNERGIFVEGKTDKDFVIQEDALKFRYPKNVLIADSQHFQEKTRDITISLVVDMDPSMEFEQKKSVQEAVCPVFEQFVMNQESEHDQFEVWTPASRVEPVKKESKDKGTVSE